MRQLCRIGTRLLSTITVIGVLGILWTALDRTSAVRAMTSTALPQGANAVATTPVPTLFRQHCVGCHNERMKSNYGNLSLENIDLADVSGHVETLEKVVRKLRKGQMPPEGRPRPDAATLQTFIASLEAALDRVAEQEPHPGRVVSRRLN